MVFGCARFCVAFFGGGRFHARTQFIATFHFVLLGHDLLAFDFSLLDTAAAWPVNGKWMCCWRSSRNVHVNRIDTRTCYISTMPIPPIAPDNRVCCNIDAAMVAVAGTSNPARPLCYRRRASLRECIELHALAHQYRMTSSTANSPSNSIAADTADRCMCEFVPPAWFRANTKMVTPPCQCLRARNL